VSCLPQPLGVLRAAGRGMGGTGEFPLVGTGEDPMAEQVPDGVCEVCGQKRGRWIKAAALTLCGACTVAYLKSQESSGD